MASDPSSRGPSLQHVYEGSRGLSAQGLPGWTPAAPGTVTADLRRGGPGRAWEGDCWHRRGLAGGPRRHTGLRIWCPCSDSGRCCGLGLIPGLGTSTCLGHSQGKAEKGIWFSRRGWQWAPGSLGAARARVRATWAFYGAAAPFPQPQSGPLRGRAQKVHHSLAGQRAFIKRFQPWAS